VPVASEPVAADGSVSLGGVRYVVAGPFELRVAGSEGALALQPADVGVLTLPGAVGVALLLLAAAYAEALLRPLRRGRGLRAGTPVAMALVGAVAGVGADVVGWAGLHDHLLTVPLLLLTALFGLAAGLSGTLLIAGPERRATTATAW